MKVYNDYYIFGEMMNFNVLSLNLQQLIDKSKLTITEIADKLKITEATINKIKSGRNINPTIKTLKSLADFFGITLGQLIGETNIPDNDIKLNFISSEDPTKLIPIISWDEVIGWPSTINTIHDKCYYETNLSPASFAIIINTNDYSDLFKKYGQLIIDPSIPFKHNDYVLVYKSNKSNPSIKKLINIDGDFYLKSLVNNVNLIFKLTDEYSILGVIISYKINFTHQNDNLLKINFSKIVIPPHQLPLATIKDTLSNIINIINDKKLGFVIILNNEKYPIGIITDGDLRKNLIFLTDRTIKISKIMTKNPKTINIKNSVFYALKYMQTHKITTAIVIDDNGLFLGAIHIHDLINIMNHEVINHNVN